MISAIILGNMVFFYGIVFAAIGPGKVSINEDAAQTKVREVTLALTAPKGSKEMKIANTSDFKDAVWEPFVSAKTWLLDVGQGTKTVHVKFQDKEKKETEVFKDTIALVLPANITLSVEINKGAATTASRYVSLSLTFTDGIESIAVSNQNNFSVFDERHLSKSFSWILSPGSGKKTVYIKYADAKGQTKIASDTMTYEEPAGAVPEGSLIKAKDSLLYYFGFDGQIHPFLHTAIYHSWYQDFANVVTLSPTKLKEYPIGSPVCIRAGTWLVKFQNFPTMYAPEPGCWLRPLRSVVEAEVLYGPAWGSRVITLSNLESGFYTIESWSVHNPNKKIFDKDHDGVDSETEKTYGSSEATDDTDADGITDYEELFVWFTDPTMADTDGNGTPDAKDILSGTIGVLGVGDYAYPQGTVLRNQGNEKLYYQYIDNLSYYISGSVKGKAFKQNNLNTRFIVTAPPSIVIKPRPKWQVLAGAPVIQYPTVRDAGGNLLVL